MIAQAGELLEKLAFIIIASTCALAALTIDVKVARGQDNSIDY